MVRSYLDFVRCAILLAWPGLVVKKNYSAILV